MTENYDDSPSIKAAIEHAKSVGEVVPDVQPEAQPEAPAEPAPADTTTTEQPAA